MTWTPLPGMYIALRLNPVAMVEHLEDPIALDSARQMQPGTYIAYVDHLLDFPWRDKPAHRCSVKFAGRGLPTRLKDEFMESTMCVPIFPNTSHPLSREPLRPKTPFPFSDCYQYSLVDTTVRVPTQDFEPRTAIWMSPRQTHEHNRFLADDFLRRAILMREKGVPGPDPDTVITWERHDYGGLPSPDLRRSDAERDSLDDFVVPESDHDGDASLDQEANQEDGPDGDSASSMIVSDSDGDAESVDSSERDFTQLAFAERAVDDLDIIPLVEASQELTSIERIMDPLGFLDEQEAIIAIIKESRARNATAFAETNATATKSESSRVDLDLNAEKSGKHGMEPLRWHKRLRRRTIQVIKTEHGRVKGAVIRVVGLIRTHLCLRTVSSSS
ncbi:predicted protein [Postia placenta Mad-698-R]|nr:predicted protein [Postia placenta Mad-698-R]